MEDCRRTFDISRAWTLRASRESRYGSFDELRRDLLRELGCKRRARRGGDVKGTEAVCGAYKICASSSSVSVSLLMHCVGLTYLFALYNRGHATFARVCYLTLFVHPGTCILAWKCWTFVSPRICITIYTSFIFSQLLFTRCLHIISVLPPAYCCRHSFITMLLF